LNLKNFNPTNKNFTTNFRQIANPELRKGHLNEQDKTTYFAEGTILRINKRKVYSDGWEVLADKKTYNCTYEPDGMIILPEYTDTENYYVPKKENNKCEVLINENEKKYRITNIYGLQSFFNSLADGTVVLEAGQEDDSTLVIKNSDTQITLQNSNIEIEAEDIIVGDTEVIKEIEELKENVSTIQVAEESGYKTLEDRISELEKVLGLTEDDD